MRVPGGREQRLERAAGGEMHRIKFAHRIDGQIRDIAQQDDLLARARQRGERAGQGVGEHRLSGPVGSAIGIDLPQPPCARVERRLPKGGEDDRVDHRIGCDGGDRSVIIGHACARLVRMAGPAAGRTEQRGTGGLGPLYPCPAAADRLRT